MNLGCILVRIPLIQLYEVCKKTMVMQQVIQYRYELEQQLDQLLRSQGLGYCDGGSTTPFECEIFLYAASPRTQIHDVRRVLNERNLFDATLSFQMPVYP